MRAHGKTMGSRRASEDKLKVAERGAMLKGKDESHLGWVQAPKLSLKCQLFDARVSWAPGRD